MQSLFKKLRKKNFFNAKNIKSLMSVAGKNCHVKNYMFKIYIENTRIRCEICSKLIIKTPQLFFYCWLWTCIFLLGSYLHFYCMDDFHCLDHFHCLHDLQKNWNLIYILKLAYGWVTYRFPYAVRHNDARGWEAITKVVLKLLFRYWNLFYL